MASGFASATGPRLVGRFAVTTSGGARVAWSGTTAEARFTGARRIVMRLRAAAVEPHTVVVDGKELVLDERTTSYSVFLDDKPAVTLAVSDREERYEVATGLDERAEHVVRIVREAEAFAGEHEILGLELSPGGRFLPVTPRPRRLELVGDSIMCGYGALGADAKCPFTYATERATAAYPQLVARALDADVTTLCWSGRGAYRNYDGSTTGTMPDLYERTLPSSPQPFPFQDAAPEAVVVALGTNDFLGGGGKPLDVDAFVRTYVRFLARVREKRPDALVVVATSPMLDGAIRDRARKALDAVVEERRRAGDTRVELIDLAYQGDSVGCDSHPNAAMHAKLATQLATLLRARLDH